MLTSHAACVRRELQAFVFVFEAANRIVVEVPEYKHATYFFDLEQPLPVSAQVCRNEYCA